MPSNINDETKKIVALLEKGFMFPEWLRTKTSFLNWAKPFEHKYLKPSVLGDMWNTHSAAEYYLSICQLMGILTNDVTKLIDNLGDKKFSSIYPNLFSHNTKKLIHFENNQIVFGDGKRLSNMVTTLLIPVLEEDLRAACAVEETKLAQLKIILLDFVNWAVKFQNLEQQLKEMDEINFNVFATDPRATYMEALSIIVEAYHTQNPACLQFDKLACAFDGVREDFAPIKMMHLLNSLNSLYVSLHALLSNIAKENSVPVTKAQISETVDNIKGLEYSELIDFEKLTKRANFYPQLSQDLKTTELSNISAFIGRLTLARAMLFGVYQAQKLNPKEKALPVNNPAAVAAAEQLPKYFKRSVFINAYKEVLLLPIEQQQEELTNLYLDILLAALTALKFLNDESKDNLSFNQEYAANILWAKEVCGNVVAEFAHDGEMMVSTSTPEHFTKIRLLRKYCDLSELAAMCRYLAVAGTPEKYSQALQNKMAELIKVVQACCNQINAFKGLFKAVEKNRSRALRNSSKSRVYLMKECLENSMHNGIFNNAYILKELEAAEVKVTTTQPFYQRLAKTFKDAGKEYKDIFALWSELKRTPAQICFSSEKIVFERLLKDNKQELFNETMVISDLKFLLIRPKDLLFYQTELLTYFTDLVNAAAYCEDYLNNNIKDIQIRGQLFLHLKRQEINDSLKLFSELRSISADLINDVSAMSLTPPELISSSVEENAKSVESPKSETTISEPATPELPELPELKDKTEVEEVFQVEQTTVESSPEPPPTKDKSGDENSPTIIVDHDAIFLKRVRQADEALKVIKGGVKNTNKSYQELEVLFRPKNIRANKIYVYFPEFNARLNKLSERITELESGLKLLKVYNEANSKSLEDMLVRFDELKTLNLAIQQELKIEAMEFISVTPKTKPVGVNQDRVPQAKKEELKVQAPAMPQPKRSTSQPLSIRPELPSSTSTRSSPVGKTVVSATENENKKMLALQLNTVCKHLLYMGKLLNTNNPSQLADEIRLYALLYNVYHCFQALKRYKQLAAKMSETLNAGKNTDLRSLLIYCCANDKNFAAIKEVVADIKFEMIDEVKQSENIFRVELTVPQRKNLMKVFNLLEKHLEFRYLISEEFPLVINASTTYKKLLAFHQPVKAAAKPAVDNFNILSSCITSIQGIFNQTTLELRRKTKFTEVHFFEVQALRMLVSLSCELSAAVPADNLKLKQFLIDSSATLAATLNLATPAAEDDRQAAIFIKKLGNHLKVLTPEPAPEVTVIDEPVIEKPGIEIPVIAEYVIEKPKIEIPVIEEEVTVGVKPVSPELIPPVSEPIFPILLAASKNLLSINKILGNPNTPVTNHFALLYNIFNCFQTLNRASFFGIASLQADEVKRNLIKLINQYSVANDTAVAQVTCIACLLYCMVPGELQIKKDMWEPQLDEADIIYLLNAFTIPYQWQWEGQPELVLNSQISELYNKIYDTFKGINNSGLIADTTRLINHIGAISNILQYIKATKNLSDDSILFLDRYHVELHALRMLTVMCGELSPRLDCSNEKIKLFLKESNESFHNLLANEYYAIKDPEQEILFINHLYKQIYSIDHSTLANHIKPVVQPVVIHSAPDAFFNANSNKNNHNHNQNKGHKFQRQNAGNSRKQEEQQPKIQQPTGGTQWIAKRG